MAAINFEALNKKSLEIKFDLTGTNYQAIENIGTGAYGVVCSAQNLLRPGERVAIKKIPDIFGQTIIAMRTYREIKILKHFRHENIISIREILLPREEQMLTYRDIYIVLDLMESDLHRIIHSRQELSDEHVRYFLYQILRGLKYIHSANVVHRDLKPSNLLVNEDCLLKIGDFGMARGILSNPDDYNIRMTQYVATRWYRAPELMLLPLNYTASIDVWSVGCILAEMLGRKQLFPGREYKHQLQLVFDVVGTPDDDYVNRTSDLIREFLRKYPKKEPANLAQLYPKANPKAIRLLGRMLKLNPAERISVESALEDPYLSRYHDVDDEPVCIPAFDFSFEKEKLDSEALRRVITKEILDYHQPKASQLTLALRPVPRDELEQTGTTQTSSFAVSSKPTRAKEHSSDVSPAGLTSVLKPVSDAPDVQHSLAVETRSCVVENVDMISATPKPANGKLGPGIADVVMLSATAVGGDQNGTLNEQYPSDVKPALSVAVQPDGGDGEHASVTDAKALIKAALLNSGRRKQLIELGRVKPVVKVTTALQRQKEREEKRRRKQEKALEKKKKTQKNSVQKSPLLTDEDRNMLQRWQDMARNTRTTQPTSSEDSSTLSTTCSYNAKLDVVTGSSSDSNSPTISRCVEPLARLLQPGLGSVGVVDAPTSRADAEGYFQPLLPNWLPQPPQQQQQRRADVGGIQGHLVTQDELATQAPMFGASQVGFGAGGGLGDVSAYGPVVPAQGAPGVQLPGYYGSTVAAGGVRNVAGIYGGLNGRYCAPSFAPSASHPEGQLLQQQQPTATTFAGRNLPDYADDATVQRGHVSGNRLPAVGVAAAPFNSLMHVIAQPSNFAATEQLQFAATDPQASLNVDFGAPPSDVPSIQPMPNLLSRTEDARMSLPDAANFPPLYLGQFQSAMMHRSTGSTGVQPPQLRFDPPAEEAAYIGDGYASGGRCVQLPFDRSVALPSFSAEFDTLVPQGPPAMPATATTFGGDGGAKSSVADALKVITSRLMKSHVEDLTLKHTPRGTGVGYGVGDSLDLCNSLFPGNSADLKACIDGPESAPLSATLIADWRDVTGGLDAGELEAVLLLDMASPQINLNDLNSLT